MRTTKNLIAAIAGGLGGLALVALAPTPARGQEAEECNGFIDISYDPPQIVMPPAIVKVKITIGAGDIIGGPVTPPEIFFPLVHFFLDCTPDPGGLMPSNCVDDGPVVSYNGDATITTTCHVGANPANPLVTWASNSAGGTLPNTITFTPTPPVVSLADTPEPQGECSLEFTVTVLSPPSVGTCSGGKQTCNTNADCPSGETCEQEIPEIADYLPLAVCSNGLTSGEFQTAAIGTTTPPVNFNCYQIPGHEAGKPPQCPNCTPTLIDTFTAPAGVTLAVGTPHRLCAPAALTSVPNQPMPDPKGVHLEGYDYGNIPPSFPNIKGLTVTDVFGTITGDVKGTPKRLLVPTGKCSPPGMGCTPQVPPPPSIHHFQCYPFINTNGSGKSATGVTTDDQFGPLGPFKISGKLELCASVNKVTPASGPNGEDPGAVTTPTFLLCYPGTPRFGEAPVALANQFATLTTIIDNYDDFCVTATVH